MYTICKVGLLKVMDIYNRYGLLKHPLSARYFDHQCIVFSFVFDEIGELNKLKSKNLKFSL